jgi:outer membrane protein OmpA-like peptidoglycan-associated protein
MGKLDRVAAAAPHRSIRTGLAACALAAALGVMLPAGPAAAQVAGNGSVTVDYGALDSAPASAPLRPPASYGPPPSTYPTPLAGTGSGGLPAPGWYYYAGPGNLQGPFAQPPGKATASRSTTKKKTAAKKPAKKPTQTASAPPPQPAAQPEPAPAPGTGNVALTPPPEPSEVNPPAPLQPVTPPPVAGGGGSQTPPAVAAAPSASPTPEPAPAPAPAPAEQPAAAPEPAPAPAPAPEPAPAPAPAPAAQEAPAQPAPAAAPAPAPDGGGTQAAAPTPPPAPAADNAAAPAAPPAPAAEQGGSQAGGQAQTASLPPAAAPTGNEVRIEFPADSAEIPDTAKAALDQLAQQLGSDEAERIQLLAYAAGSDDNASRARRMSLSRALAVRSYLIAKGVRSTRMDVRALGNNVQGSPPDRVDIIPQKS